MARLALILSIVAVVIALFPMLGDGKEEPAEEDHKDIEVAVYMGRMQRYHEKLWAASKAGNAELAGFYLHELEEAMTEIVDAEVVEDDVRVSEHMRTYGITIVEALERTLEGQGTAALHESLDMLVHACNSCHAITGHSYIVIQEPQEAFFPDQDFNSKTP